MEQTSSTENQTAMAPVYGNMANLCLLCASAQNPEGQAFIDIFGKRGMHLRILDKIHKFLSTNIEAGFPLQVCVSCVERLNVCHEFVQSTEAAHEKLKALQKAWEAVYAIDIKEEALDDDWTKMDFDVPSPEADFQNEADDFENHFLQPRKKKGTIEDQQSEEFPMLRQPFLVVKGSQIAVFVSEEDSMVKSEFRLSLVIIKINEPGTYNKESISEKVGRIMQHIKKCVPKKQTKPGGKVESLPTSTALLHSCQSCQCSFFLQEEMVSHFESLHPEEVHQCTVCGENICGSWEIQEKHMELHRGLKEGETDELLSTLRVPSVRTKMFDPEFVVVKLGIYPQHLNLALIEVLQSTFTNIIQRNLWIKPDMKEQLYEAVNTFTTNIRRFKKNRRVRRRIRKPKPKVECDVCGKKMIKRYIESHMESFHNPEKMKCPHCNYFYMVSDENCHIEAQHNGGNILICKICDTMFSATGEDQPHMTPRSDFPFKCSVRYCRKVYQCEENLEKHRKTAHQPKQTKSDETPCLCDLCGKVVVDKNSLRKHLQFIHFPIKSTAVYPCDLCDATYNTKALLKRHKSSFHAPKTPCEVCGKLLGARTMSRHMKLHDDDCKIPCKYCGKLFITQPLCEMHEKSLHEGVSFRCKICPDFHFKSIKGMEEHNLKHELGEEIILPPYLQPAHCSICSKSFLNSIRLKQHMKLHEKTGHNGVVTMRRRRKAGQRNTKKSNDGPPPEKKSKVREVTIPCYACLIRFMTQESFDSHMQTHHPDGFPNFPPKPLPKVTEFRYQCRYCDKTFKKKDFCNDHETLHGGGKQYACDFCGKKYSYYSDKWTHQTKKCTARYEVGESSSSQ